MVPGAPLFKIMCFFVKSMAVSELLGLPPTVQQLLRELGGAEGNLLVIRSSRSRATLERCFGELPVALSAEHGTFVRWGPEEPWTTSILDANFGASWTPAVAEIMEYFRVRTPGSVVEVKDSCIAFHTRDCDVRDGAWQHKACLMSLLELGKRTKAIEIFEGDRKIEICSANIPLPQVLQQALEQFCIRQHPVVDFLLFVASGDGLSDEKVFDQLGSAFFDKQPSQTSHGARMIQDPLIDGYSSGTEFPMARETFACIVGTKPSRARFFFKVSPF